MTERDFKGVWIPKEIWLNTELTLLEKIIFVEIDSLNNEDNCTASNTYFAKFCNCSESAVSKAISKLKDFNMIEILNFDGRHRKIRVVNFPSLPNKISEAASENFRPNNINNNLVNNQSISKDIDCMEKFHFGKTVSKETTTNEVDSFKALYNEYCFNLPKISKLTDTRIKAIKKILKKYNREEIITVLTNANNSAFLTGNNDRGWKANIDFILREDKFVNILEGRYNTKVKLSKQVSSDMGRHNEVMNVNQKKQFKEDIASGRAEEF